MFKTVRETDAEQLEVRIDLEEIQRLGHIRGAGRFHAADRGFFSRDRGGDLRVVAPGDTNHNFAKNLAQQRSVCAS